MAEIIHTDFCVIGGGLGGLSIAARAVQMEHFASLFNIVSHKKSVFEGLV